MRSGDGPEKGDEPTRGDGAESGEERTRGDGPESGDEPTCGDGPKTADAGADAGVTRGLAAPLVERDGTRSELLRLSATLTAKSGAVGWGSRSELLCLTAPPL